MADMDLNIKYNNLDILGSSGVQRFGGWVREEWLPELQGLKGIKTYKEMRDNDPIVGAMLFAFKMLIRQADWYVELASDSAADKAAAEFLEQCMDDMSVSFKDTVQEALSMIPFGYAYHEIVYKVRKGPDQEDGSQRSRYNDGRIGWRRIPLRAQETFFRWIFGDDGSILAYQQIAPPDYQLRTIPIQKALLFRLEVYKNNPEGRSLLRNAYRPWYFKKNMEQIEGIGVERDLAGLPMATVPPEYLSSTATPEQKSVLNAVKQIVTSVKRDEMEGLVFPAAKTIDGKDTGFSFSLLATGSRRQFDINQTIERYNRQIAMTVLADFIMLGHQGVGSFALSSDKKAMFSMALGAIMDAIADVFNSFAIPRLFELNAFGKLSNYPKIAHGDVEAPDLGELGTFIANIANAQALTVDDPELENYLRMAAHLPKRPEGKPMPAEAAQQQAGQQEQFKKPPLTAPTNNAQVNASNQETQEIASSEKGSNDSGFIKRLKWGLEKLGFKKRVAPPVDATREALQQWLTEEFATNRAEFLAWLRRFTGDDDDLWNAMQDYEMVGMSMAPSFRDFIRQAMTEGGVYALDTLRGMVNDEIAVKFGADWGAEWLDNKVDRLITGLNESSRKMIYGSIRDDIAEKASWRTIADNLEDAYGFSPERAETIARTESGEAYNVGACQAWKDSGLVQAVKVSDGDYDGVCKETDGMIWSLDFAMDHPLEHPRCERDFELVLNSDLPGGEDEDEIQDQIEEDEARYLEISGGDDSGDDSGDAAAVAKYWHPDFFRKYDPYRNYRGQFASSESGSGSGGINTPTGKDDNKDDSWRFTGKPSYGSTRTYRTPMPDDKIARDAVLGMGRENKVQVTKDTPITKIRAFAEGVGGKGKLKEVEQRENLSKQHRDRNGDPIDPNSWRKCRGAAEGLDANGNKATYELHWFQAPNSGHVNLKAVGKLDATGGLLRLDGK